MNALALTMLLSVSAVSIIAGCGNEEPGRSATEPARPGSSHVLSGRYQGVESANPFAVWVVDTSTGAVVRCDTQKCGEWITPLMPASGPEPVSRGQREKAGERTGSGR